MNQTLKDTKHAQLLAAAQEQIDMVEDEPRISPAESAIMLLQIADIYCVEAIAIETEWYDWPEMKEWTVEKETEEDTYREDEEPF